MKKIISALCLAILSLSGCSVMSVQGESQSGRYLATEHDKTVQQLIQRWANDEGVRLHWEAKIDHAIADSAKLNAKAHLAEAEALPSGVAWVLKAFNQGSAPEHALFACMYEFGGKRLPMIVRSHDQAPCPKPQPGTILMITPSDADYEEVDEELLEEVEEHLRKMKAPNGAVVI